VSETEAKILETLEFAQFIMRALDDKKADNIVLLDLGRDALVADYFVICNGNSDRQAKALAENVREQVKETYGRLPFSTQGQSNSGWVILDYGNVVVHVFLEEERLYYRLEELWTAKPKTEPTAEES
jgi:ribosome-associated protein